MSTLTCRHRVVFFVSYRHCMFRSRRNQRDKWNGWCRHSVDFRLRRDAEMCAAKTRRGIRRRRMQDFEEVQVGRRTLEGGERMAR